VLDLGAGAGALTAPLVGAGARVVAVERDPALASRLRRRFAPADVTVVEQDRTCSRCRCRGGPIGWSLVEPARWPRGRPG